MFTAFCIRRNIKKHYAADLKKMLPHIPYAKTLKHFQAFAKAGRALADLHINYETVPEHPLKEHRGGKQGEMAFDNPDYHRPQNALCRQNR